VSRKTRSLRFPVWLFLILELLTVWVAAPAEASAESSQSQVTLEVFTREGCPHCDDAKQFLEDVRRKRPGLQIVLHDIWKDPSALERFRDLAAQRGVGTPGVPAFYVQGELLIGYAGPDTTGARLRALVDQPRSSRLEPGAPAGTCVPEESPSCAREVFAAAADTEAVEIPLVGYRVTVHQFGLPLFTFVLGVFDGFNPCSMWVLILMLSMLASLKDRLKMVLIASTFVAVEGIAYFAFMAAWLNMFLLIGLSRASEVILGGIACVAGVINLKDFWALGRGISLSIPKAARPGIYAKIRSILRAEHLIGALVGAVVLAVFVQVVELLCTSGFPALYTRILTRQQLDRWTYYGYLLLYDIAYMLDDVLVLAIGAVTLSQRRLQEKEGRCLKLLSGVVMLGLGVYLIAAPYWADS
jgi:glutaredoxin/cytochrome c biogenesis protein CcdA